MTRKEIFDRVTAHLSTQGQKAVVYDPKTDTLRCVLRNEKGQTCAVGCLLSKNSQAIKDDFAGDIYQLVKKYPEIGDMLGLENIPIICRLQDIHDYYDPASWPQMFAEVKKEFRLN